MPIKRLVCFQQFFYCVISAQQRCGSLHAGHDLKDPGHQPGADGSGTERGFGRQAAARHHRKRDHDRSILPAPGSASCPGKPQVSQLRRTLLLLVELIANTKQ